MLGAIGLVGGAVSALAGGGGAGGMMGALAGGGGAGGLFEAALSRATSALGGGDGGDGGVAAQLEQKMTEGAVGVMGGMMMRLAGEVLNAGMEDDGE